MRERPINRRTNAWGDMVVRLANGRPLTKAQAALAERGGLTTPEAIEAAWRELIAPPDKLVDAIGDTPVAVACIAPSGVIYLRRDDRRRRFVHERRRWRVFGATPGGPAVAWTTLEAIRTADAGTRRLVSDPDGLLPAGTLEDPVEVIA